MAKTHEKEQAANLRKAGYSIAAIASALHVSKSTASLWVRGMQAPIIRKRPDIATITRRSAAKSKTHEDRRRFYRSEGKALAKNLPHF